jgi:hypothetical protein
MPLWRAFAPTFDKLLSPAVFGTTEVDIRKGD